VQYAFWKWHLDFRIGLLTTGGCDTPSRRDRAVSSRSETVWKRTELKTRNCVGNTLFMAGCRTIVNRGTLCEISAGNKKRAIKIGEPGAPPHRSDRGDIIR
jgi:hypothetical protein